MFFALSILLFCKLYYLLFQLLCFLLNLHCINVNYPSDQIEVRFLFIPDTEDKYTIWGSCPPAYSLAYVQNFYVCRCLSIGNKLNSTQKLMQTYKEIWMITKVLNAKHTGCESIWTRTCDERSMHTLHNWTANVRTLYNNQALNLEDYKGLHKYIHA